MDRLIARMDNVRERISQVRLVFIETVDKHTEIDQVTINSILCKIWFQRHLCVKNI